MRKEYKVKSMPPWYYAFIFGLLVIAIGLSIWYQTYGWVFFLAPTILCLQGLIVRIVIDKGYVFSQGMLVPYSRVKIENIRKIKVHFNNSLRIFHSRGVLALDPANSEAVIDALLKENPAITVERK